MRDPVLEEEIAEVEGFIEAWNGLFALAGRARSIGLGEGGGEAAFLDERNSLVQRYPELMSRLEVPLHADDEVMQILGRMSALDAVVQMPEPQWRKVCDLHGHTDVALWGMLGALQGRRRALASVSRGRILIFRVLGSWPLKLLYMVAAILGVFAALKRLRF